MDYNVSSWPWFGLKPIVRVKTSFKKLLGGWVVVVHLDYNVSYWPWFGLKPIVRVKISFKKLSVWVVGWLGGGALGL